MPSKMFDVSLHGEVPTKEAFTLNLSAKTVFFFSISQNENRGINAYMCIFGPDSSNTAIIFAPNLDRIETKDFDF